MAYRFSGRRNLTVALAYYRHRYEDLPSESQEEFQSRVRRTTKEQEEAAERRKREAIRRKEDREEQRVKGAVVVFYLSQRSSLSVNSERRAAEERQRTKASNKKAQAEVSRKIAESKARALLEQSQTIRSAVFAAARSGDAQKVKKGVYEDHVDAAGGEAS